MKYITDIWNSLKNNEEGLSGRKLTAITLTTMIVMLHVFYCIYSLMKSDFSIFISVILIDLLGVAFFLGLVTIANIIELKNGKNNDKEDTTTN